MSRCAVCDDLNIVAIVNHDLILGIPLREIAQKVGIGKTTIGKHSTHYQVDVKRAAVAMIKAEGHTADTADKTDKRRTNNGRGEFVYQTVETVDRFRGMLTELFDEVDLMREKIETNYKIEILDSQESFDRKRELFNIEGKLLDKKMKICELAVKVYGIDSFRETEKIKNTLADQLKNIAAGKNEIIELNPELVEDI